MSTFDEFMAEWLTNPPRRVADPSLVSSREETPETMYQCVSLIKQYLRQCFSLNPGAWGNAIQYWTSTNPTLLPAFARIQNSDAQRGDIVVLWGLPGNAAGHIGVATGNGTGTQVEILEQNGQTGGGTGTGGDAIRTRYVDRSRVAGLLRPIAVIQAPVFTTSVTPFATPQQWIHNGNFWNLDQPNFDAIAGNPLSDTNPNPVTVVAYLTRSDLPQYVYLLPDASVHHGYNQVDCAKYTPPPAPYVPPAAPMSATPAEKYTLVTNVMTFNSATEAIKHSGVAGALVAGDYFVISKRDSAYNLSDNNMKDKNQWVNTADNVLEVVSPTLPVDPPPVINQPTDVSDNSLPIAEQGSVPRKLYYDWIDGVNHAPVWFHSRNVTEQRFKDLENPDTTPQAVLPPNKDVRFSMVTIKNGVNYYIPTASLNNGNRHGVPETLLRRETPAQSFFDEAESDFGDWTRKLAETPQKIYTLISDISPVSRHKVALQVKQVVDGFKKGSRK